MTVNARDNVKTISGESARVKTAITVFTEELVL